jgi:hypothetical protein
MWIKRRAGGRLARFADAAVSGAQRRSGRSRAPEQARIVVGRCFRLPVGGAFLATPANLASGHCAFRTSGEHTLLNEKRMRTDVRCGASFYRRHPGDLQRHPRDPRRHPGDLRRHPRDLRRRPLDLRRHPRESGDPVLRSLPVKFDSATGVARPSAQKPVFTGPALPLSRGHPFAVMTAAGVAIVPASFSYHRGEAIQGRKRAAHLPGLPGHARHGAVMRSRRLPRARPPGPISIGRDSLGSGLARDYSGGNCPGYAGRAA